MLKTLYIRRYLYVHLENPSYIQGNSNYTAVILFYGKLTLLATNDIVRCILTICIMRFVAFIVGFQITHSLGYVALSSGVSTIFVA